MTENYVTLFDSTFLPQGLALHMSMQRHIVSYTLWILCVDDLAYDVLTKLKLENVKLLKLSKLETEQLLKVKSQRSIAEYCWTLTPFAISFVMQSSPEIKRVTYIDSDLWFRKNPDKIFHELEMSGKHVLITDHAYSPEYDQSSTSGQYCVQFMIFMRKGGEKVRKWWEDRCVEWCYAKHEDGKFGDQKYLDCWPDKFKDEVHVMEDKELALAPWNSTRFAYGQAVFYHFHGFRIVSSSLFKIGGYRYPDVLIKYVYRPYILDIKKSLLILADVGFKFKPQALSETRFRSIYNIVRRFSIIMATNFKSEYLNVPKDG